MIRTSGLFRLTAAAAGTLALVLAAIPTVSAQASSSRERSGLPIGPAAAAHGRPPARSSTFARDTAVVVDGSVRRAEDGTPIWGARVIVVGRDRETLTDTAGRFHLGGLSPGAITLRVQFPDAQTAERHLLLRAGESTTLAIAMMTRPIPQSELRAVAPGRGRSTPVSRLLKRLEAHRGQIVGHDEIGRYHGTLNALVGARNIYGPGTRMRPRAGFQLDRSTWCEPEFFVDGSAEAWVRQEVVRRDRSDPLGGFAGLFGKDEIATIEIYPPEAVPTDLDTQTSEQCGAIVLWLKSYLGGP